MGWIVINPANQTYDGVYAEREVADAACESWQKRWSEPMCYVHQFDGDAVNELEPHYTFMADVIYKTQKESNNGI